MRLRQCLADAGGLKPYLQRLAGAFGWRYVLAVISEYGGNQGIGWQITNMARKYYVIDNLHFTAADYGRLSGFAGIPWSAKALFGLLSDLVPCRGLHRAPYLGAAGVTGAVVMALLLMLPVEMVGWYTAALIFCLYNCNIAFADVIIDATVARRLQQRPKLAANLQSLCWGSYGLLGAIGLAVGGSLLQVAGSKPLFCLAALFALGVVMPACLGWLGELPEERQQAASCTAQLHHPMRRRVAAAAALVGVYSIAVGILQLTLGHSARSAVAAATLVGNLLLCLGLWLILRGLDGW